MELEKKKEAHHIVVDLNFIMKISNSDIIVTKSQILDWMIVLVKV